MPQATSWTPSAAWLVLACLSGCIPYGYPTAAYIPPVRTGFNPEQVHAFRVDLIRHQADLDFAMGTGDEKIVLTPLALSADGTCPQARVSFDHGLVVLTPALSYRTLRSHSVAVRLYRRGYELVEIKEGDRVDTVLWKAAPDAASQEKALDDLFPLNETGSSVEPGSVCDGHKQALLFGAAEYDQLADGADARLAAKAEKMRKLAGQ